MPASLRRAIDRAAAALTGRRPARDSAGDRLGLAGERLAARHLRGLGYKILGRNLRVPMGEADLLCLAPDRATIVLVEVKTRRVAPASANGPSQPPPEASVHARKRAKLRSILHHLARANGWTRRPLRIDVVAIDWPPAGPPVLRHHMNAVATRAGR